MMERKSLFEGVASSSPTSFFHVLLIQLGAKWQQATCAHDCVNSIYSRNARTYRAEKHTSGVRFFPFGGSFSAQLRISPLLVFAQPVHPHLEPIKQSYACFEWP